MADDALEAYQQTKVQTTPQEQVLLKLYDGAIEYMNKAIDELEAENPAQAHDHLIRVQKIVTELMATLDMEVGGEIAQDLFDLYEYVMDQLIQANLDKDPQPVRQALPIMEELNEAWIEVIEEQGMTIEKARKEVGGGTPVSQSPDETSGSDSDSTSSTSEPETDSDAVSQARSNLDLDSDSDDPEPNYDDGQDVTYGDVSFQG